MRMPIATVSCNRKLFTLQLLGGVSRHLSKLAPQLSHGAEFQADDSTPVHFTGYSSDADEASPGSHSADAARSQWRQESMRPGSNAPRA